MSVKCSMYRMLKPSSSVKILQDDEFINIYQENEIEGLDVRWKLTVMWMKRMEYMRERYESGSVLKDR